MVVVGLIILFMHSYFWSEQIWWVDTDVTSWNPLTTSFWKSTTTSCCNPLFAPLSSAAVTLPFLSQFSLAIFSFSFSLFLSSFPLFYSIMLLLFFFGTFLLNVATGYQQIFFRLVSHSSDFSPISVRFPHRKLRFYVSRCSFHSCVMSYQILSPATPNFAELSNYSPVQHMHSINTTLITSTERKQASIGGCIASLNLWWAALSVSTAGHNVPNWRHDDTRSMLLPTSPLRVDSIQKSTVALWWVVPLSLVFMRTQSVSSIG